MATTGPDTRPEALVAQATALLREGDVARARDLLDRAAAGYRELGATGDAATCYAFAAGLHRLAGDLDAAYERANRASRLAADAPEPRETGDTEPRETGDTGAGDTDGARAGRASAAAETELGEVLLATGRWEHAADALARALVHEADPLRRVRLHRRRAAALFAGGAPRSAALELRAGWALAVRNGDPGNALRILVEQATVLTGAGVAGAPAAVVEAERAAREAGDHAALASLGLLRSGAAVAGGDLPAAYRSAELARRSALDAVDPLGYVAAARALSELAALLGDDVAAYGALATGWATLGDLTGPEPARTVFRPLLERLRSGWGPDRFDAARTGYERRRAAGEGRPE